MKTMRLVALAALCGAVGLGVRAQAADTPPPPQEQKNGGDKKSESKWLTQGNLAEILVRKLGLYRLLPGNPNQLDSIMILSQHGIYPSLTAKPSDADPTPGWNLDPKAEVTLAHFAVIMVRALGLEDKVHGDKKDIQNWLNVLKEVNVPTDDPIEGLSHLRPLRDIPEMQPLFEVTGDPLSRRYVPDSLVSLINTITFSEIQPPPPTTPEQGKKKKPVTPT